MKVGRINLVGKARPPCVERIRISERDTVTKRGRIIDQNRLGLPVDQCSNPSYFTIDGKPYCTNHAGQIALKHLAGEDEPAT